MDKLEENLNLPNIGGQIVASYERRLNYSTNQYENVFSWQVIFIISGYNYRYNSGVAFVSAEGIQNMIKALEGGLSKISSLKAQSFSGTFSKKLNDSYNPMLELKAENGKIWIDFSVMSSTGYRFSRSLTPNEAIIAIDKLKAALQKENQMIETLKALI
jgi:hypothetical protein